MKPFKTITDSELVEFAQNELLNKWDKERKLAFASGKQETNKLVKIRSQLAELHDRLIELE